MPPAGAATAAPAGPVAGEPSAHASGADEPPASVTTGALVAVCLPPFVSLLSTLALSPFLPFIADELDTSVTLLGQVPALMMLAAAALGLVIGPIADRVGLRATLVFGLGAAALGALVTAAATSLSMLLAVALVTALARAIGQPMAQAVVGTHFTGYARRRAMSAVQATTSLSPILGVPLLTAVGELAGWRAAFLVLAVIALAAIPATLALLPADHRSPAHPSVEGSARSGSLLGAFGPFLHDRQTLGLFGATFVRNLGQWAILTYLGAFFVQEYALTAPQIGLAFTATGVGSIIGSLATGGPLGRLPLRRLAIGMNVLVLGLMGIPFVVHTGALVAVACMGIGFAANGVVLVATNTTLVTESRGGRATTTSLNGTCMSLGGAVGSSLGGVLLALGGYPAIGVLALACGVVTPLCVLAGRPR